MIQIDTHMHTHFSGDAFTPPREMAEKAVEIGLKAITITDHLDFDYPSSLGLNAFVPDKAAYRQAVAETRELFCGKLDIYYGIEIGLIPSQKQQVLDYIKDEPYDFIIGSTHVANGKDPYQPGYFDGITDREGYIAYFKAVQKNVEVFDEYNVFGHLDYVIRYGKRKDLDYRVEDYREWFEPTLKALIAKGKGIEINTGGWSRGISQPHPHPDIIRLYHELGGEIITVGSDAHKPKYIGDYFDRAAEILKDAGFRYYAYFVQQKPVFQPLA
ncbi:MAG: histidinol-phosphatase HisJ family protein [Anaerolineaceae bacterium]|jgi:histidinol-phosphatase (PHP family)